MEIECDWRVRVWGETHVLGRLVRNKRIVGETEGEYGEAGSGEPPRPS